MPAAQAAPLTIERLRLCGLAARLSAAVRGWSFLVRVLAKLPFIPGGRIDPAAERGDLVGLTWGAEPRGARWGRDGP